MSRRSDEVDELLAVCGLPPRAGPEVLTWSRDPLAALERVEALRGTPEPLQTLSDIRPGSLRWEALHRIVRPPHARER